MQALKIILAFGLLMTVTVSGSAQETAEKERLKEVEEQLEKSRREKARLLERTDAADAEIRAITQELIAGAGRIQNMEQRTTLKEADIQKMSEQVSTKQTELAGKKKRVAELLAALQRMSERPSALLLTRPEESATLARSSVLLSTITPQLEREAEAVGQEIREIKLLRAGLAHEHRELEADLDKLQLERADLGTLLDRRKTRRHNLESSTKSVDARITALASEAKDLKELVAKIQIETIRRRKAAADAAKRLGRSFQEKPSFPAARPFSAARGNLSLPARGQLVERFGDATIAGTAKGIKLRTRSNAQVVAPYDGRIVFAGPFRTYGQLLIIEHGEGYISLLAGMSRLDGVVDQWILAGEPVGVMGSQRGSLTPAASSDNAPELYIEIRRYGDPINPLPWLSMGQGKVSG